jgi:hypothetical protein
MLAKKFPEKVEAFSEISITVYARYCCGLLNACSLERTADSIKRNPAAD